MKSPSLDSRYWALYPQFLSRSESNSERERERERGYSPHMRVSTSDPEQLQFRGYSHSIKLSLVQGRLKKFNITCPHCHRTFLLRMNLPLRIAIMWVKSAKCPHCNKLFYLKLKIDTILDEIQQKLG